MLTAGILQEDSRRRIVTNNITPWGKTYHENFAGETLSGLVIPVYRRLYNNTLLFIEV